MLYILHKYHIQSAANLNIWKALTRKTLDLPVKKQAKDMNEQVMKEERKEREGKKRTERKERRHSTTQLINKNL